MIWPGLLETFENWHSFGMTFPGSPIPITGSRHVIFSPVSERWKYKAQSGISVSQKKNEVTSFVGKKIQLEMTILRTSKYSLWFTQGLPQEMYLTDVYWLSKKMQGMRSPKSWLYDFSIIEMHLPRTRVSFIDGLRTEVLAALVKWQNTSMFLGHRCKFAGRLYL